MAGCGSPWLLRLHGQLYDQSERYRRLSVSLAPRRRNIGGEHQKILDAALARDADKAVRLLAAHLDATTAIIIGADIEGFAGRPHHPRARPLVRAEARGASRLRRCWTDATGALPWLAPGPAASSGPLGVARKVAGRRRMSPTAPAIEIAGVRLTHPDKQLYPEERVAKRDLALYYKAAAGRMLPHVSRRLLSVVRCPEGRGEPCFFQRHPIPGSPDWIHRFKHREKKVAPDFIYIEDVQGLVALAQMGVLEIHVWGSHVDEVDRPDRMVFDLDPADDVPFADVKFAALHLFWMLHG